MFIHHLKYALRFFGKQKLSTGINILGLSLGIACASLAFICIRHEYSFDRFHEEADHIYWLHTEVNQQMNLFSTPNALGPSLKNQFPEITEQLRLQDQEVLVYSGTELFRENAHFVENNFFSFFNFPLVSGDPSTVFQQSNSVVLNEATAKKYFGRIDPINQSFKVNFRGADLDLNVSGVVANAPGNSSLQFQILLPLAVAHPDSYATMDQSWKDFDVTTFIRLRETNDLAAVQAKMPSFMTEAVSINSGNQFNFLFNAFIDYRLHNHLQANGLEPLGEYRYVQMLSIFALFILLTACLNFMNLANAQGSGRMAEIGVRQILGAGGRQLTIQLLFESVLISFMALLFAIFLLQIGLPYLSAIFDYPLQLQLSSPMVLGSLLGITLLTGLLAGSYPSYLLSRLKAVQAFQSQFKIGRHNWMTKGSLTVQFALSIGLLICTFLFYQQQQFISERNLGFNQEAVLVIPTQCQYKEAEKSEQIVQQFRSQALPYAKVKKVAGVSNSFTRGNRAFFVENQEKGQDVIFNYRIDEHYLDLMEMELTEGRGFAPNSGADQGQAVIVNETFIQHYESVKDNYLLPEHFEEFANRPIIGVVKDFHHSHLRSTIKPLMFFLDDDNPFHHVLVKIDPSNIQTTIQHLKTIWQDIRPDKPFEFSFLDDDLQRQYQSESRWSTIITATAILALLISGLGLFGLVSLSLRVRTREISIRKVLGASVGHIVQLLSADFLRLVGLGLLLASPVAWYFMQEWLANYPYRIDISWWAFISAGLVMAGFAFLLISVQSIRAALTNPVNHLKEE